jgi:hypothetical protein
MTILARVTWIAMLLVVPWRLARAAPDADPSGHWEGSVQVPGKPVAIEVDLARNARGELIGTLGNPAQGEKGLPLATVAIAGREVRFAITARSGGGSFRGTLRDDGQAIAGEFTLASDGTVLPFQLARTGDARIAPAPRSPAISKRLAGSWTGTLAIDERSDETGVGTPTAPPAGRGRRPRGVTSKQVTLALRLANQPDGSASGTLASDGLELPVAIAETAAQVRIDVPSVSGSFVGAWRAAGTQLVGTWTQRSASLPLTFQRAAK